jgi:ribonuclease HI
MISFHNRDNSGWINKWVTELSEYIINFESRTTITSQILVGDMVESMEPQSQVDTMQEAPWLVYCDGAWGSTGAGATAILTSPSGMNLRCVARLQFTSDTNKCTNNIIEYEAILLGLWKLRAIDVQTCMLRTDPKWCQNKLRKNALHGSQLKVHLGPYLISVIENNPNKNLIISMSIKQEFRQSKRRKRKRDPKFVSIKMKGLWRSSWVFQLSFLLYFLSIEIPYY